MARHTTDRFCTSCGSCRIGTVDPYTGEVLVEVEILAIPDDICSTGSSPDLHSGAVEVFKMMLGGDDPVRDHEDQAFRCASAGRGAEPMSYDEQPDDPHGECRLEIERLQDDLDVATERVAELDETVVHLQARLDAVCEEHGHLPRVRGDWPEDNVCPRCGDLETGLIEHAPEPSA